jgi:hypothetical protein
MRRRGWRKLIGLSLQAVLPVARFAAGVCEG